ncbi:BrnT family toxin [Methylobacterium sp. J-048]|uniref:BrnT family toxin n=1 Tax=Methylobacterium sp. J-048 TaxID=2836635 RepID=UPI001FBB6F12|nr:BrnT family toxin [Methylobacterium sp. J-048]MCJ2056218.1 BrnT family toxin [Methylobacterium sp. J-048]
MRFTYSQPKRQANIAKHRFDLTEFEVAFSFDRFLTVTTKSSCTGRKRFKLIGSRYGEIVVVAIVSPLGSEAIDVVSVRPANAKEKARYAEG